MNRKHLPRSTVAMMAVVLMVRLNWAEPVYFLLAARHGFEHDSCVLPLTRVEDIAEARRQLNEIASDQRPFPVVTVRRGADGINRDYLSPGARLWSWHVAELVGFAELAIPEVAATPAGLEKSDWEDEWLVALVTHCVVAELSPLPLTVSATAKGQAGVMELSWLNLGENYVYTVETAASVDAPNWAPVEGTSWPSKSTTWVDTSFSPTSGPRMYRVRAELEE